MVWYAQMSEIIEKPFVFSCFGRLRCPKVLKDIEKPEVFLWYGRLRCPKVLENLRFSCGLECSDGRKYCKTLGFLVVWELRCPISGFQASENILNRKTLCCHWFSDPGLPTVLGSEQGSGPTDHELEN